MGGRETYVYYEVRPSPSQIAALEREKKLREENEKKMKKLVEEQKRIKEENEKKQKEEELKEKRRKEEELEKKRKEKEERIKNLQNQAFNNFRDKCNLISIEKINKLNKLFPGDFTKKFLQENTFTNCSCFIRSIYDISSRIFKLEDKIDKILDTFLKDVISKINSTNSKLNILVIGPTGVGKSTLINEFLHLDEEHKAKVSDTDSCTMTNELYESEKNPQFGLIDTRGIEKNLELFGIQKMIENIKKEISERNKSNDPKKFIHGIWYCMNSSRFEDSEIECLIELSNIYRNSGLPIIIVFTQSLNKLMAEEIEKKIVKLNNDFLFVRVLAKEKYLDDEILIPPNGLENLKDITLKKCSKSYLPAYIKTVEDNIKHQIDNYISSIKKRTNYIKNISIIKKDVKSYIKREIYNLYNKLGSPIFINQFDIELEKVINSFFDNISLIFRKQYECYDEYNKKDLFNRLKELNAEMRKSNNYLIKGINKITSDSFYQKNINNLNVKKENFKAEYILNYFTKEFSSLFYENIKSIFSKLFNSKYIDKIRQEINNINFMIKS